MIIYLDTNIILSFFDIKDHFHIQNKALLEQQDIVFVTGIITIVEFESVIGRLRREKLIKFEDDIENLINKLPESVQTKLITEICFSRIRISILPISALEQFDFNNETYSIENGYNMAYKFGPQIQLRTLDTLQIAAALKIKTYSEFCVEYFLTNDKNILNKTQLVRKTTDIIPISSSELSSILKIN
ncbi:MAG: PIN domain-containing protein [Promethearchaeota archaeon]